MLSLCQVFKFFCDDITDDGLLRMLHIVKKDLKPPRRQVAEADDDDSDDEDEEDLFGIEDTEEANEPKTLGSEDSDDGVDDSEAVTGVKAAEEHKEKGEEPSASDAYESDMDDDAMFLMDSYIAQLLKERRDSAGSDTAQSQLNLFKLRVLTLLEIYLQRNPGWVLGLNCRPCSSFKSALSLVI